MKYKFDRDYRKQLTIQVFKGIINGMNMAQGTGHFPELDKDNRVNWVAVKGYANDWSIYWGREKDPYEFIHHNGTRVTSVKLIKELTNCTEDVLKLYRK